MSNSIFSKKEIEELIHNNEEARRYGETPEEIFLYAVDSCKNGEINNIKNGLCFEFDSSRSIFGPEKGSVDLTPEEKKIIFGEEHNTNISEKQLLLEKFLVDSICAFFEITKEQLIIIRKPEAERTAEEKQAIAGLDVKPEEVNVLFDKYSRVINGEELETVLEGKKEEEKATSAQSVTKENQQEKKELEPDTDPLKVVAKLYKATLDAENNNKEKKLRLTEAIFGKGIKEIANWRLNLRIAGVEDDGKGNGIQKRKNKENERLKSFVAEKRNEFAQNLKNLVEKIKQTNSECFIKEIDTENNDINNEFFYRWIKKAVKYERGYQPSKIALFFKTGKNTRNDAIYQLAGVFGINQKNVDDVISGTLPEKLNLKQKDYKTILSKGQTQPKEEQDKIIDTHTATKSAEQAPANSSDSSTNEKSKKEQVKDHKNYSKQVSDMKDLFKALGFKNENIESINNDKFDDLKTKLFKIIGLDSQNKYANNNEVIKACKKQIKEVNKMKNFAKISGVSEIDPTSLDKNYYEDLKEKIATLAEKTKNEVGDFKETAKKLQKLRKSAKKAIKKVTVIENGYKIKLNKGLTESQLKREIKTDVAYKNGNMDNWNELVHFIKKATNDLDQQQSNGGQQH